MISLKMVLKRIFAIIFLVIVCFVLQTSVFPSIQLAGITPNVLLALTVLSGFMRGRREGMITGFLCGLLIDAFFPIYFGAHALIYMLIGYLNGVFSRIFYGDDIKFPILITAVSDILYSLTIYVFMFLSRGRLNIEFYILHIIIPEILYTILVTIVMFFPMFKIDEWLRRDEKRGVNLA